METYNFNDFKEAGIDTVFVQDNQSASKKGVLRGLHFQINHPQTKLVRAIKGEVYDVRMEYDAQQNGNTDTYTVTVICPEDYDGTVFDIGCAYKDLSEMYDKIDLKKKLYTIDELPYYGDHYSYYYFSSSDK